MQPSQGLHNQVLKIVVPYCPPPFSISTITYKVGMYAPAERANTLPLFLLCPTPIHLYVLCGAGWQVRLNVAGAVCWHNNSNIEWLVRVNKSSVYAQVRLARHSTKQGCLCTQTAFIIPDTDHRGGKGRGETKRLFLPERIEWFVEG